ncbi:MAG: Na+/H+ antiporter subunit E [Pseudonocardia sediminis]
MSRVLRVLAFVGWFTVQFVRSNVVVARQILTPRLHISPAVVAVELRGHTRFEIATLISLIGLTPGTLALTLLDKPRRLVVHSMHATDVEEFRAEVRELEDRMLAAVRPAPERAAEGERR